MPYWFVCILFNFRNFRFIITKPTKTVNQKPNILIRTCAIRVSSTPWRLFVDVSRVRRVRRVQVCHHNRAISGPLISARPQSHCNGPSRRIPARILSIMSSTGMTHTPIRIITSELMPPRPRTTLPYVPLAIIV